MSAGCFKTQSKWFQPTPFFPDITKRIFKKLAEKKKRDAVISHLIIQPNDALHFGAAVPLSGDGLEARRAGVDVAARCLHNIVALAKVGIAASHGSK